MAAATMADQHPEIFIGDLPTGTTALEIQQALAKFDIEVDSCRIKQGRSFGFARLCGVDDLEKALAFRDLIEIKGEEVTINRSTSQSSNVAMSDPTNLAVLPLESFSIGLFAETENKFLERWNETATPESSMEAKFTVNFQKSLMHICFQPSSPHIAKYDYWYKIRLHFRDLLQVVEVPQGLVRLNDQRSFGLILRFKCAPELLRRDCVLGEFSDALVWVRGDIEEEIDWRRTTESFCDGPMVLGRYFDYLLVIGTDCFVDKSKLIDQLLQRSDWGRGMDQYYFLYQGVGLVTRALRLTSTDQERQAWASLVPFSIQFLLEKMVGEGLVYHELLDHEFFSIIIDEARHDGGTRRVRRALEHIRDCNPGIALGEPHPRFAIRHVAR